MKIHKIDNLINKVIKLIYYPYLRIRYGYKGQKYILTKGKPYVIIANHMHELDPMFISMSFNRPVYFFVSDKIFDKKKSLNYFTKMCDIDTGIEEYQRIVNQSGVVGLFTSELITYSGVTNNVDKELVGIIRKLNCDVIMYQTNGLYGLSPQFAKTDRHGKSIGNVKKALTAEYISSIDDDALYNELLNDLVINEVEDKIDLYTSKYKAESLERVLYVCPDCFSKSSLSSSGNIIKCNKCGYKAEYLDNMKFKLLRGNNEVKTVYEWCLFQKGLVNTFLNTSRIIVTDNIKYVLHFWNINKRKKTKKEYKNGIISLYSDRLEIYKDCSRIVLPVRNYSIITLGKKSLCIHYKDEEYCIRGNNLFNALKYVEISDEIMKKFESIFR